ncbi:uncharacterized protein LOC124922137 [Impatiens glandulifera]|uniref:uncharacterized protein LOC124922137 n=1 Tax=Impatiens glandulifera TaxID=253017 RepID=UPI001FB077D2|nr:uncharacterized protein LOC124922137 [Impatiens glandulifera]
MAIDWFSWLAKTGLDSSLVYDYGLSFSQNELEEEDITYLNHEFLQSMGISIAKHRLEILKLASKETRYHHHHHSVSNIIVAIKRTKKRLAKCIRSLVHRNEKSGGGGTIVIVPKRSYSASRLKGTTMLKRNKKMIMNSQDIQGRLLLTNGSPLIISDQRNPRVHSFSSPLIVHHHDLQEGSEKAEVDNEEEEEGDPYWSSRMEIRWDAMFQDLKPT